MRSEISMYYKEIRDLGMCGECGCETYELRKFEVKLPQGHAMYGEKGCGLNEMGEMCDN